MLQFPVKIGHAGEHGRTAGAETVGRERFVGGSDDFGMIGQAEVVVGAKINHRLRPAVVGDGGARFRRRPHLRFVKFDRPRSRLHPASKAGRRLEWIARFGREEITQAKFGWIVVHKKTAPGENGRGIG